MTEEGMGKLKKILKDKRGMSYPLTVALVLALLITLCVLAEFFRLSIIAYGIRDALQESVISVATTNYNEVYDGLREGYSGSYFMTGDCWEETLDYGDVYTRLDRLLGTNPDGGYHVKWQGSAYEYMNGDFSEHPYLTQSGADREENGDQYISNMRDGAVAGFKYFGFDEEQPEKIRISIRGNANGAMKIFDSEKNGRLLAEIPVKAFDEERWSETEAVFESPKEVAPLFFRYEGDGAIDFRSFRLE